MSGFKVTGGCNTIGTTPKPSQTLTGPRGAKGASRYGSMTSPIEGQIPNPRQYRPPPSQAEVIHDLVSPNFARTIEGAEDIETIKTNRTKRNTD